MRFLSQILSFFAVLLITSAALAADAPAAPTAAPTPAPAAKPAEKMAASPAAKPATLSKDSTVAKVNGEAISGSDMLNLQANLRPPMNAMPLEMIYPMLQERLIDSRLVADAAKKAKLADDKEVKERTRQAQERIMQEIYLAREMQKQISEDKLKERYKKAAADFKPEPEIQARHILVKTETEAKQVIQELQKGGDFAALARTKSTDTGSAVNGGDLGFFTKEMMVPAFADAAFKLKDNEITKEPIKTEFGYHIIQATAHRQSKIPTYDEAKNDLQRMVTDEALSDLLKKLRAQAKIEKFGLDGKPVSASTTPPAAPKS
ncbi:MAG: peptidylprolyl isomerase [Dongiaceae bacterium]